jgi:hypothetical protein
VSPKQSSLKNSQNGPSIFKCIEITRASKEASITLKVIVNADAEQNEKQSTLFKT